ncbi:MAG: anaphase promoting complex subunit doc1 [Phylliscum demangeonii]|nr:MAG: anaphase promoting complex subunit doc1 [Phylliscum demangeonii]
MNRAGARAAQQAPPVTIASDNEPDEAAVNVGAEDYTDDVSEEDEDEEDAEDLAEGEEGEGGANRVEPFDSSGLREIGNLASWTVSTAKPGCGVEALRDDSTTRFWQSDGPQPHLLNIHFIRMVSISHIRIYLDVVLDESYTPTRISFLAGTSPHDLIEFVQLALEHPKGWIDVGLAGVGGGPDGNTLRAHLVQLRIAENHQNGKDTHLRGLQIYAREDAAPPGPRSSEVARMPRPGTSAPGGMPAGADGPGGGGGGGGGGGRGEKVGGTGAGEDSSRGLMEPS